MHRPVPPILLLVALLGAPAASAATGRYRVTFDELQPRTLRVDAELRLDDASLLMYPEGAERYERGWATFVSGMAATDAEGRALKLLPSGKDGWTIEPAVRDLRLHYVVTIDHDRDQRWPFGVKEAAYARPGLLFATGKAIFVANLQLSDVTVAFEAPSEVVVESGLRASGPRTFHARDAQELTEVVFVLGRPYVRPVRIGSVEVRLVSSMAQRFSTDRIAEALDGYLQEVSRYFDATPNDRILVVAEVDPEYEGGGAAFSHSISLMLREPASDANRGRWEHILAHEATHLWNGTTLQFPNEAQEYWFSEGYTEYVTQMLLAKMGRIEEEELLKRLVDAYADYTRLAGQESLQRAGNDKVKWYDLVYGGGTTSALALDVELRSRTSGRVGLRDLMRLLYRDFAVAGRRYTTADVDRACAAVAGSSCQRFFDDYVRGHEQIPMAETLRQIGWALAGDGSAAAPFRAERLDPPTAPAQRLHDAWRGVD